jgi:ribonucleoside-diphosphate reductase alpha chain
LIKTIIKRNGDKEDFSPEKLNGWGEWAAKSLGQYVDWSSVVLDTVATLPEKCTSIMLQERLIKTCLDYGSWSYNLMAGRLYAALINKNLFNDKKPTIKELHTKLNKLGFMNNLDYSDEEYDQAEKMINHKLDFKASYFELHQVRQKYSIKNRLSKEEFESQQFVYMRMAMALAESQPKERRMEDLKAFYEEFSEKRLSAPTPNFVNLGTPLRGLQSCCLYQSGDNANSLAIGDHIAYIMTCMSAGIGNHLKTRSIDDPVRGGVIKHLGKLGYYRSLVGAVKANLQNGRGGAVTTHYSVFDPEVEVISQLKNPMSTEDKKIRGMDYSAGVNKFFAKKAAKNEEVFLFNCFTAPDLFEALYSSDVDLFQSLYERYEKDSKFKKTYVNARQILLMPLNESYETGRAYFHWTDEMNSHTPFKDVIYSSNLCQEIMEPTKEYFSMLDLYSEEDHGRGEVATCSLAGVAVPHIKTEEQYAKTAYYGLLMIDKCIHLAEYPLTHVGVTTKARMNAGVGIVGLAYLMAKNKQKYSTREGKEFIHDVAERHYWHLLNASLKLGKELGNAKWMYKTRWPEGWLPLDTYNKNVDSVISPRLNYDWEGLRKQIIENKGIRNSVLAAHMPTEASSKAAGLPNGVYPIRELALIKTDGNDVTYWAATEGERLSHHYEFAWDIETKDMVDVYAIIQKWTDQGVSADFWRKVIGDDVVTTSEMIQDFIYKTKMGLKSQYYQNSLTSEGTELNSDGAGCDSGVCTL